MIYQSNGATTSRIKRTAATASVLDNSFYALLK